MLKLRGFALNLQDGPPQAGKPGDQDLIEAHEAVQSQAVAKFPGAQAPHLIRMFGPPGLEFPQQIFYINKDGDGRDIDIALEHAVGAVHGTVEGNLEHLVAAADIVLGSGAIPPERSFLDRHSSKVVLARVSQAARSRPGGIRASGPESLPPARPLAAVQNPPGHGIIPGFFLQ